MALNISITRTETVKPSLATPPDQKVVKLSFLDQFTPVSYPSALLFYPFSGEGTDHETTTERSRRLRVSLSEALTRFFPLAGRVKDNAFIDCNDSGVEFVESQVQCLLSDILKEPDMEVLKQLLPAAATSIETAMGHLLLIKACFFDCGGMAVGVSISHKVADAATLATFIKSWAAIARSSSKVVTSPVFLGASTFPPVDFSIPMPSMELVQHQKCITRRLLFDGTKITALKAKVASKLVTRPTRVEAVSGLIWRCAATASRSRSGSGSSRRSAITHTVNMRQRLDPAFSENYAGNYVGGIVAQTEEAELDLKDLVGIMRTKFQNFAENFAKKLQGDEAMSAIGEFAKECGDLATSNDTDFYNCSSWCNLEMYDADLGWGKPTWLSIGNIMQRNFITLIDTKDGHGIEAWVTLTEEDMALFESNEELLEFAAVNPPASFQL